MCNYMYLVLYMFYYVRAWVRMCVRDYKSTNEDFFSRLTLNKW